MFRSRPSFLWRTLAVCALSLLFVPSLSHSGTIDNFALAADTIHPAAAPVQAEGLGIAPQATLASAPDSRVGARMPAASLGLLSYTYLDAGLRADSARLGGTTDVQGAGARP